MRSPPGDILLPMFSEPPTRTFPCFLNGCHLTNPKTGTHKHGKVRVGGSGKMGRRIFPRYADELCWDEFDDMVAQTSAKHGAEERHPKDHKGLEQHLHE